MSVATSTAIALAVGAGTAASSAYAAHKQGQAADKATDAQTKANDAALAFAKERYAQSQANQRPYQQAGVAATGGIGNLLSQAGNRYGYSPQTGAQMGAAGASGVAAPGGMSMVSLQAPDGSVMQKPAAEANHWIQLGAKPVQS